MNSNFDYKADYNNKKYLARCGAPARTKFLGSLREEQAIVDNVQNTEIHETILKYSTVFSLESEDSECRK